MKTRDRQLLCPFRNGRRHLLNTRKLSPDTTASGKPQSLQGSLLSAFPSELNKPLKQPEWAVRPRVHNNFLLRHNTCKVERKCRIRSLPLLGKPQDGQGPPL